MLSIQLNPETEKRLATLAKQMGQSEAACARELIEENIDDLEDRYSAEKRLADPQPSLTSQQARKELGLEH